jgi:hypothetical protein
MKGKGKKPLTESDKPKVGGKISKVMRAQRRKSYYAGGEMRQIKNRRVRIARHLRRFPEDAAGMAQFLKRYGNASPGAPTKRAAKRAQRRLLLPLTIGESRFVTSDG